MNEKFILTLVDKFNNANIDELNMNDGTTHLILRKGLPVAAFQPPVAQAGYPGSTVSNAASNVQADSPAGKPVHLGIPAQGGDTITSPIVATFYTAPGPDAPPFVTPGARVKAGDTLCILEAMKMMNHLEAEFDCEIVEIHAQNGDLVEYDQLLFTVKRR